MSVEMPLPPVSAPEGQPEFHGFQFLNCESHTPLMQVWQARTADGTQKWVKIISGLARKHTLSPEELKRIVHLKFVKHPRLLPYEEIENEQGQLVVVTPRAEFSLRKRQQECLQSGMPGVPRDELLIYLQGAAEALDFLDRQESLHHLCLHPSDLVVVDGEVRVTDYGLFELAWMPSGQPLDLASLRYAAPELFENEYSRTADQYTLALIYCEMLTGKLPFSASMAKQMREQRLSGEPDLSLLPQHDAAVLRTALQREAGKRYETIGAFLQALEEAVPRSLDSTIRRRIKAYPQGDSPVSAGHADPFTPEEVERTVSQLVQLAAYSTVVKEQGGLRYHLDDDGRQMVHRCAAWLPPGMAWQKLEAFAHQWMAALAEGSDERLVYRLELPQNFWRRFVRAEPDHLEIVVGLAAPRSAESKLTEVSIAVRYRGRQPDEGMAAIQKLGPTLIYSVRSYLLATTEHRRQERFSFDYPLWVYPSFAGQMGEGMSCHGKNISRQGIGFLAPYRLPAKDVLLQVVTTELGALNVPAAILRTQPLTDGQYEVGARFKKPGAAAIHQL